MTMMTESTRAAIKGYLDGFIKGVVDAHKKESNTKTSRTVAPKSSARRATLKPFHEAILPAEVRRISSFERSFSTSLGATFEECAFLIAKQIHKKAERNFNNPAVMIPLLAARKIEELVAENNAIGMTRLFPELVEEVLAAHGAENIPRHAIADLYFQRYDGSEWFFEIKSPQPNKGQCLEVTQRLLTIQAIQALSNKATKTYTYFAMAYNPYGYRKDYAWSFANRHLDMKNQVLLQGEFWNVVGDDPDTYDELLSIFSEVGRAKGKYIVDELAFSI